MLDKFVKFITLDYSAYPDIDLSDEKIIELQFGNVKKFESTRNKLYFLVLLFCAEIFISEMFIAQLNLSREVGSHITFMLLFRFTCIILIVFLLSKFKCPKCGSAPQGRSIGLSGGVTYTKGINPFPSRCVCCGFYLRKSALKRDIKLHGIQGRKA